MVRSAWLRLKALVRRRRLDEDLDDEIQFHLARRAEQYRAAGMSSADADCAARRRFGNTTLLRETCQAMWTFAPIETVRQDLQSAARTLRKNIGVTAGVVTTLALGIGANSAIFSVVNAVLLKPLPYQQDEQLVMMREAVRQPGYEREQDMITAADFIDWKRQATAFEDIAGLRYRSFDMSDPHRAERPTRVEGDLVSANLFSVLRVDAALGRVFTADEDRYGGPLVAVLGYSLWRSRFGGDPGIIGQTITLDGRPYTIVGVMPEWFHFFSPDDQLWAPLDLSPGDVTNRIDHTMVVVGRLKRSSGVPQAQAEMQDLARQLAEQYPTTNTGAGVHVVSLREQIAGNVRSAILILWGCAGLVLLIVCANVASLLLARAFVRQREISIRMALGASRGRVFRQLLTESLLLSSLGGSLGLLVAFESIRALRWMSPPPSFPYLPRLDDLAISGRVLLVTAFVSLAAGILFGTIPALQVDRAARPDSAWNGGRGLVGSARACSRTTLIAAEIALGMVVLIGTALLLRSYFQLNQVPLGFQPQHVLTLRVIPRGPKYGTEAARVAFYDRVCQEIEALPGVQRAGAVTFMPLTLVKDLRKFFIEGRARPAPNEAPAVDTRVVTAGYFESMGVPVLEGRGFTAADRPDSASVAIVSRSMARTFWPGGDAIGQHVTPTRPGSRSLTVVGVVGDVRNVDVVHEPEPTLYLKYGQTGNDNALVLLDLVVRSQTALSAMSPAVREAIWRVDPDLSVARVHSMEDVRFVAMAPQWLNLRLLGMMAALAAVLAAQGLYGVMAYSVAQRTREIGLRIALGAERGRVLASVLGEGARMTAYGVIAGGIIALSLTRLMGSLLFQISPTDPIAFTSVVVLLGVIALTACCVPAYRATRIDPMTALRCD